MTDALWQWVADVTVAVFERRMRNNAVNAGNEQNVAPHLQPMSYLVT